MHTSLSVLTTLGPPVTVASALMLYFGWARTEQQARYMGLDVSLFGYSAQDYVMRSISTLYLPLLVLAVVALGGLDLHRRLASELGRGSRRRMLRVGGAVAQAAGLLLAAVGVVFATSRGARVPLLLPLALAGGTVAATYGGWLARAARDAQPDDVPPAWQRATRTLLVGGVITLALFWQLSAYAGVVGRGQALEIARSVTSLPRATAFSVAPLHIQADGVREDRLAGASPDVVLHRTTGLRLLTRSAGRIFLLHDGWTPATGSVIVLPDDEQVRWQFSR